MNKFKIGDTVFVLNIGYELPLIEAVKINAISQKEDGIYYTTHGIDWFLEDMIFKSKKEAYQFIKKQCENEINNPEGIL